MSNRAEKTKDKLDLTIDEGIKVATTALNVLGVNTTASCEGHLDHGTNAPYVDVEASEARGLAKRLDDAEGQKKDAEAENIFSEIERKNLEERKKLIPYLDEFYDGRNVSYDTRLIIRPLARHWSRIESQGVDLQEIADEKEKAQKLESYQKEMKDFAEFLKRKYFSM